MTNDIEEIQWDLKAVYNFFSKVIDIIPSFNITDRTVLPYGLKPHTRSISWIAEQVIVQQAKFNKDLLLVDDVNFEFPDTSLHDCELKLPEGNYFVNIKVTNAKKKQNKNDIAAVEKLYKSYTADPDYRLLYAVFPIVFNDTQITFTKEIHTFSPQFLPIYVNPSNDKIQAFYHSEIILRTREEFLQELVEKSKVIKLKG